MNKFPGTNFHDLNLDWVINQVKMLTTEWITTRAEWTDTKAEWQQLYSFVSNYFANLNVTNEINAKIDAMIASGQFMDIIRGTVEDTTRAQAASTTSQWLADHIVQETGYVLDNTLSIANAAADAKAAGDKIAQVQHDVGEITGAFEVINYSAGYYATNTLNAVVNVGSPSSSATWVCAAVQCSPGERFTVIAKGAGTARPWAFLDSDRRVLSFCPTFGSVELHVLEAPQNAAWIVINSNETGLVSYRGVWLQSYTNDALDILITRRTISHTEDTPDNGFYRNESGKLHWVYSSSYRSMATDISEIPMGSIIRAATTIISNTGIFIAAADGTLLDFIDMTNVTDRGYSSNSNGGPSYITMRVPDGAAKLTVSITASYATPSNVFDVDVVSPVIDLIKDNPWFGKRIWWCGTSIPAGRDTAIDSPSTGLTYPEIVGKILGAKAVYNTALGSSMARANVRTGDYVNALSHNILRSMSQTVEEKNTMIANWDTIRLALRDPGTYTTLSDSDKYTAINSSFERTLLPYLNGTNPMPDVFVFDHGHNDWKSYYTMPDGVTPDTDLEPTVANITGDVLAEDTYMTADNNAKLIASFGEVSHIPTAAMPGFVASVNRNCFIGAINFLCTLILSYNPRARIIFIGNLDNWSQPQVQPAQESVSASWCFPLIRTWEYLGFSGHYIPNTSTYWNPDGTTDLTAKGVYCKDGVHPHSDTSGIAIDVYAKTIANAMRTIV